MHGIAALCQRIQQREVRRHRAGGLLAVGGVLTEIVNGDEPARIKQPGAGTEYVVLRFTGDEPGWQVWQFSRTIQPSSRSICGY
ncbi:Uncharacterised protein [Mycobacteroides abscessus subsp. abscessus]|nr:Uncharacterised protein [Mycobacteroides abscessus subsp. abscessus]